MEPTGWPGYPQVGARMERGQGWPLSGAFVAVALRFNHLGSRPRTTDINWAFTVDADNARC